MLNRTIFFFCIVLSGVLQAEEPVKVTVLGDSVNLRNEPSVESDVISAANYGDILQAVSFNKDWVEVMPVASVSVWAYAPLLFEEKEVRAQVMNIRSGPGTQFPILGQLKRGDEIEVLESLEDWRKIKTPDTVSLWISRKFVQVPPSVKTNPTPVPKVTIVVSPSPTPAPAPPKPQPTPETIVEIRTVERVIEVPVLPTPTPKVEAPEGLNLVPLRGQGSLSIRRGVVKTYLLAGTSPSRFMLVRVEKDGTEKSMAYLRGNDEEIKALSGSEVQVRGRDFWVAGQKLPVTKVDELKPLGGNAGQ